MSKKRVHEIAKELKSHGIELDNKEVVTELVSLGYDVKSHSSSLEDDQAQAAVSAIVNRKKPKAAPPPVAAKGFVVRRRPHGEGAPPSAPAQSAPSHAYTPSAPVAAAPPPPPPEPEPVHETSEEEPQQVAEAVAAAAPEPMTPVTEPVQPATPPTLPPAVVAAPPAAPVSSEAPMAATQPAASDQRPVEAPRPAAPAAHVPQHRPVQHSGPPHRGQEPFRRPGPGGSGPSHGRPSAQVTHRPGVSAASRPPMPAGMMAPRPGHGVPSSPANPGVDPKTLRPTATQAVVLSRPLVQVRRVTPPTAGNKQYPMAPGKKAIGEVREFKVVPDHLGRGRELVDVSKNKNDRNRKRTVENKESSFKQEVSDLVWGRVALPIRGKKKRPTKKGQKTQITEMSEEKKVIKLQEGISVSDLAQTMGVRIPEIIKKLMAGGTMATANQMVDVDTAGIIATDYGWRVEKVGFEVEEHLPDVETNPEDIAFRPPVVTVMGHVDHGKTSLLDAIRKANVASGEAGGITQHIGAYTVRLPKGDITFLDTPGHEAFTSMRARGADVTDIVILVVAADDGVMPQTIEAMNHAKAAEVPVVVAINKIDVPGANPDRVKKELADRGLLPEDWGGETIMVPLSAKTKEGIDTLLENLLLQAEVLELKANPKRPGVGAIIEAKLEKGRGPVATVLVQEGTLRVGDAVVTGTHFGRIRAMVNDRGEQVKEVAPGYSAEVLGLSGVPTAGDAINVVEDEKAAKEIAEHRVLNDRKADLGKTAKGTLEDLLSKMKSGGGVKELKLVLKSDVQGSAEAVAQAVNKLSTPKVKVTIVHQAVGQVTESDVMLAAALKAIVIGFNVRPESGSEATAKAQEVTIQTFGIIYELLDSVRSSMEDLLEPIRTEKKLGRAEVRNLFNVPKLGTIAGSAVIDGTIKRSAFVRLIRDNKPVYTGKLASLKRFKDDVKEVAQGFECGIGIENYSDIKPGDIIEAYEIEETRPSLS